MSGIIDKIRGWRGDKPVVTHEEYTETKPEVPEYLPGQLPPRFITKMTIEDVITNSMDRIQMHTDTGEWDLERNWKHMVLFYRAAKQHANLMEHIVPDDDFRKDMVAAEREPDFVEQGNAIIRACARLFIRREVGLRQREPFGVFDADIEDFYAHYPSPEMEEEDFDGYPDEDFPDDDYGDSDIDFIPEDIEEPTDDYEQGDYDEEHEERE